MFPKQVKYVLTFFDVFGYNSGSSKLSNRRETANSICFLHFLFALFFTCFTFYLKFRLSPHTQLVELLNHLLQYSSTIYMYWFTIWDSFHNWHEHYRFWEIYRKINKSFQSQRNFACRLFMLKIFSIILTTILSLSIYFLTVKSSAEPITEILAINIILNKLCEIRIFYYLFCLEVIHFQLKSIEIVLKKMCKQVNLPPDSNVYRFKWVQQYYHCVYEMAELSNYIFNWSQVAAVSFCFYTLLTDLNWIFIHFNVIPTSHFVGKY